MEISSTRRQFLVAAGLTALAGCQGDSETPRATESPTATPTGNPAVGEVSQQGTLELTSPAFASGEPIPAGWNPADAVEGTNDFGNADYGGPAPPETTHTYRFKCFALETTLDLSASATIESVGTAMEGNVFAQTQLTGTYSPQNE